MKMKKILSVLLVMLLLLGLCGCSQEDIELAGDIAEIVVDVMTEESEEPTQQAPQHSEEASDEPAEESGGVPSEDPEEEDASGQTQEETPQQPLIDEFGTYTSKEDVALYIHVYGRLPDNFITKDEARDLGWEGGGLEPYAPGCCIGGDRFGNREGLLPQADGRYYTECDIDTLGASSRGAKRIVFSNDGLVYYTDDHYESFELLYGEE